MFTENQMKDYDATWENLSDRGSQFLSKLMDRLYEDMTGTLDIPVSKTEEWGFGRADELADILPEFLIAKVPFKAHLYTKRNQYYLKVQPVLQKDKRGYYIYRYFVDGDLMYIGRTNRPAKRYLEHCRENLKFRNVDSIEVHRCLSKNDMIFLERLLISEYMPPWNDIDAYNGELSYETPQVSYERYSPLEVMQRYN